MTNPPWSHACVHQGGLPIDRPGGPNQAIGIATGRDFTNPDRRVSLPLRAHQQLQCHSELEVFVSGNGGAGGALDPRLDYNQDGDFADAGEQIFVSSPVIDGRNVLSFNVPSSATAGRTLLRLRLSSAGGLTFDGVAIDGEVAGGSR